MYKYEIAFTRTLELIGRFTIEAENHELATIEAEKIITGLMNNVSVEWSVRTPIKEYQQVEWEENSDDYTDVEVNEV